MNWKYEAFVSSGWITQQKASKVLKKGREGKGGRVSFNQQHLNTASQPEIPTHFQATCKLNLETKRRGLFPLLCCACIVRCELFILFNLFFLTSSNASEASNCTYERKRRRKRLK